MLRTPSRIPGTSSLSLADGSLKQHARRSQSHDIYWQMLRATPQDGPWVNENPRGLRARDNRPQRAEFDSASLPSSDGGSWDSPATSAGRPFRRRGGAVG